jgi:3-methyladenine DNA glycosylase AlkD
VDEPSLGTLAQRVLGGEQGVTGYLQMLLGMESDHGRGAAVMGGVDARRLIEQLVALAPSSRPGAETELAARARDRRGDDIVLGVRMAQVFGLAAEFIEMDPSEVEKLLQSPIHEVRVGALSIMDKQARRRGTPEARRMELFDLYLRRMDRINSWDLVDLGAPYVVGRYLLEKPRRVLFKLARSKNPWERRTAIVSTLYFVRQGDVADTFRLAELLLDDPHDSVQKATGGLLREAGKKDRRQLLAFLDQHAAMMARVTLRYAMEHLEKQQRSHYRDMTG